jgi:hypothetical protein
MNHEIVFPMDADVQPPLQLRRAFSSAASSRIDQSAISHGFAWTFAMQVHTTLNYDETAHTQTIQPPPDIDDYLDSLTEEEYRSLVTTVLNCTSLPTLPGNGVPTRD